MLTIVRSVAISNHKGGVGKTTTAVHLAHGLALSARRVALVDLDYQGSATVALQGMLEDTERLEHPQLRHLRLVDENLWMLPSGGDDWTVGRAGSLDGDALRAFCAALRADGFDWLVIDCPPRMDEWTWVGLSLCEDVLVPVQAEFLAIHGLAKMTASLAEVNRRHPGKARLWRVLITMFNAGETVAREIRADLQRTLGEQLCRCVVFRDASVVEAASHGLSLFRYEVFSKASRAYLELVKEVIRG